MLLPDLIFKSSAVLSYVKINRTLQIYQEIFSNGIKKYYKQVLIFQGELKDYISQNPTFQPGPIKTILTKEERLIKERQSGKPMKPPNSAYSLFSRLMLQGDHVKNIPPKDRMKTISDMWKECPDTQKEIYREQVDHLMSQYKLDFASYLETLSEEKRQEELHNNLPKRKPAKEGDGEARKGKLESESLSKYQKVFEKEPQEPPM